MRIYNSLSRNLEEFQPFQPELVVMYVCGLTPYDSVHIGHARTTIAFDMIKRYLRKKGYSVYHIQNITDVEDKIIKRCKETGAEPKQLTEANHDEALELFEQLNVLPADIYPKVTEHIPDIIAMIGQLLEKKHAYETKTGIYFDVSSFPDYGKLSGQNLEQIKAGSRFEVDETKNDPADFGLWKRSKGEILEFGSPWGKGRPGWHIECSAMSAKYSKRTLDIHGGARDLIFPHHENEIAQGEGALGRKYCNYWVHSGFLTVEGEKMSKSLGNFITLKQALSKSTPNALRLFYLQAHYRSPLDYDEEKLEAMEETVERIFNSIGLIRENMKGDRSAADREFRARSDELVAGFYRHMDDDFNTPEALASMFSLFRLCNSHIAATKHDREQLAKLEKDISDMVWIFGLKERIITIEAKLNDIRSLLSECGVEEPPQDAVSGLETLISLREEARNAKDYKKADLIRSRLASFGIVLEDSPSGAKWKAA